MRCKHGVPGAVPCSQCAGVVPRRVELGRDGSVTVDGAPVATDGPGSAGPDSYARGRARYLNARRRTNAARSKG